MCGILGHLDSNARISRELLCLMRDRMIHRGPDDAGVWMSEDETVGLAHRRLSVVDLSASGHQPMLSRDGRYVIVLNGEIYNFRDVRRELQKLGQEFRGASDTEVLLVAYANWGAACLEKLDGMYAFAVFDTHAQTLFAARDRAGEKPFYYRHDGRRLVFASELKSLLAHPELPRKISPSGLDHYLAFGYVPGDLCILEGYSKLAAGHQLKFDARSGRLDITRYWNMPVALELENQSDRELEDRLHALLTRAVSQQLSADVPVGVLLSGGLDSSIIAAIAARSTRAKVRTYSVSFPGSAAHDESHHAQQVASYLGTEHQTLPATEGSFDLLPRLVEQFDEPLADSSMIPTFMVSQLVRTRCTVALGGDGADELFGGYLHYPWVARVNCLRRLKLDAAGLEQLVSRTIKIGTPGRNLALSLLGSYPAEVTLTRLLDPALRHSICDLIGSEMSRLPEQFRSRIAGEYSGSIERQTALDFAVYLSDDILVKVDRASMLNSLEVRSPFLDRQVVEFAFASVPATLKVKGRGRKLLLRRLARSLLPPEFDAKRKQGFTIPLAEWLRGAWKPLVDDLLRAKSPLFVHSKLSSLVGDLMRSDRGANRIFQLAVLEAWRRRYRIEL